MALRLGYIANRCGLGKVFLQCKKFLRSFFVRCNILLARQLHHGWLSRVRPQAAFPIARRSDHVFF